MEKHVLVIDREKFIRSMFEHALKDSELKIYAIEQIQENYYLFDDLKPVAVFFDIHTCMGEFEKITSYNGSTRLFPMGFPEDFDLMKSFETKVSEKIEKPISATQFKTRILELCLK